MLLPNQFANKKVIILNRTKLKLTFINDNFAYKTE